jgi:YidC/Oxa1 family membrane protein insertase
MTDQKNFLLAIVISTAIIMGYQFFYEKPRLEALRLQTERQEALKKEALPIAAKPVLSKKMTREQAITESPRIAIKTPALTGTVSLKGARFDDIHLENYRTEVDPKSSAVALLSPSNTEHGYFAELGWLSPNAQTIAPTSDTVWQTSNTSLTPQTPLTLSWDNGAGVRFEITYAIDDQYMITATTRAINTTKQAIDLHPFGLIQRLGSPVKENTGIHAGSIGTFDKVLEETDYKKLEEKGILENTATQGWVGISDKYWLTALIPQEGVNTQFRQQALPREEGIVYQTDFIAQKKTVQPNETITFTTRFYAGAKQVELLDSYSEKLGIPLFDRAVNFGLLYIITKPLFYALHYLYAFTGNFGWAIVILTVLVRLVLLGPLAHKSYKSMNALKELQPHMEKLKEKHGDDKMKLHQEIAAMYKREKVNPVAGCLPILIQIPVFIALYRVLMISLEMRHAPFFGWVRDLSAPDTANIFTAFGYLNIPMLPSFLHVGVWPLLMGITMFLSQRMNPKPTDKTQEIMFNLMPIIFTFVTATLPAGLAVYWTFSNIASIAQQALTKKSVAKQKAAKA